MSISPALPTKRLRSPIGLAKAATVFLGVVIAVDLFSILVGANMYSVWDSLLSDGYNEASSDWYGRVDRLYAVSGLLQNTSLLLCAIVFILWFHRIRANAEIFAPGAHSKAPAWAVWGWLVPLVSLWYPRRIALDSLAASRPEPYLDLASRASHPLVNAWWTLWITSRFFGNAAGRLYARADEADEAKQRVAMLLASHVIDIAAAVLAICVVRKLTATQHEKAMGPAPSREENVVS